MDSRVERHRYEEETIEVPSRVAKNQNLYNDLSMSDFSKIKPNDNVKVIETSGKRIDLEKIKKYIETNNDEETQSKNVVVKDDLNNLPQKDVFEEEKIYDINSVLELAKEKKESYYEDEKHKKLRDTQYDILSKIKLYDEEETKEKEEEPIELNTDEKTLIDLINTVTKKKEDLLEELKKGNENTVVTAPIKESKNDEIVTSAIKESEEKKEEPKEEEKLDLKEVDESNTIIKTLDKSFFTNSMTFSKEDFEGFDELEKSVKKNNKLVKVGIFVLVLLALVTVFIVLKYVLNLF